MDTKLSAIVASLALSCSAGAHAQSAPASAGSPGPGWQSQQSGVRTGAGPATSKQQIDQQYKAAMRRCDSLKENAKDICKAEADGQKKVAEAQAKVAEHDSPKNRLELEKAKADAEYNVAKEKCDDQVGDAKNACVKQAKAARESAVAQAEMDAQKAGTAGGAAAPSPAGR